ncbi:MAG: hypothetical protein HY520_03785 [Candidatus Aenigmarchaeota archaeon]|nr:hypothetical protein [Candidatus Aenigmarchaeota archaeon]
MDHYCIICKELASDQFQVEVKDTRIRTSLSGRLCRFCYFKFVDSFHHRGFFKVAKMVNWIRKKDPLRVI